VTADRAIGVLSTRHPTGIRAGLDEEPAQPNDPPAAPNGRRYRSMLASVTAPGCAQAGAPHPFRRAVTLLDSWSDELPRG
jgi:hypothetical protein